MDNFDILYAKIIKTKYKRILTTNYINNLNENEIEILLNYSNHDFLLYCKTIDSLYKNNKMPFYDMQSKVKIILNIVFNNLNKKNIRDFLNILVETNYLSYKDAEIGTYTFLNLNSSYKKDAFYDILTNLKNIYIHRLNINDVLKDINNCQTNNQIDTIYNLYHNLLIIKNKNFNKLISLIHLNPNYKGYSYIISLINDYNFMKDNNTFNYIEKMMKLKDINQIKLIYDALKTPSFFNSSICSNFINYIIYKEPINNYDNFDKLVIKKKKISDSSFNYLVDIIYNCTYINQANAITALANTDIIKNIGLLKITIDIILKTINDFKLDKIIELANNYQLVNDMDIFNSLLNGILNAKHKYQIDCLLLSKRIFKFTPYYKKIINEIIQSNSLNSKYINIFLHKYLFDKKGFLEMFNKLVSYKEEFKKELFMNLLDIEDIFDYNFEYTLSLIDKCNKEQSDALYELCDNEIYKNDHYELIKYLFIYKDKKYINLIRNVLLNIDRLGYDKTLELLRYISNFKLNINLIYNEILVNLENRKYEFDELSFINKSLERTLSKVKKLKISDFD